MTPIDTLGLDWKRAFYDWLGNYHSSKTRRAYHDAWRDFLLWYTGHPRDATASEILSYRFHLENTPRKKTKKPLSAASINQHLAALGSFYDFVVQRQFMQHNPAAGVRRKPVSAYGKARWLDGAAGQDVQLLKAINTRSEQGRRDLALFLLFLTSALRVGAVANLYVDNIRAQGRKLYLRYTEKGGEDIEKALEPVTADAIKAYLAERPHVTRDSPLFVATPRGRRAAANLPHINEASETPLTVGAINKLLRSYCDRVFGKGHGITPHALRHTAARNALLSGATLAEISKLLSHKTQAVTLLYLQSTDDSDERVSRKLGKRYTDL